MVQLGMFGVPDAPPAPDPSPPDEPSPPVGPSVPIQLGLFGAAEVAGVHVVAAHFRQLASGDEVFVGEHLRNNRGRSGVRALRLPVRAPPAADQPGLFGSPRG